MNKIDISQLDITKHDDVLTIVPRPPGISEQQYVKITKHKMAQQKLWRELWLIALKAFGAKVVWRPPRTANPVADTSWPSGTRRGVVSWRQGSFHRQRLEHQ